MEVPTDFAEQVEALSSSTPREAIANLLSALLPRVAAQTRAPTSPTELWDQTKMLDGDMDDVMRRAGELERQQREIADYQQRFAPDPMSKLTRKPSARKPLPTGRIVYIKPNPKKRGSVSAARYDKYVIGMTAAQAICVGVMRADIEWDTNHNFIRFE